jgi:hypothetical protein
MLRLTIDGNEIELYENEPVNLSYQFSNLQEINASSGNYSQTFRVPLTKKNQDYFGPVNEFGLIPNWNPKTKVDAELSYNTIPVMRGFVQVKAIYVQKGKYADVELVFFGETANLSRDIGDGMLTDLDLSAYDHTLNATNIEASWTGNLSSGAIRYGLPDKGQNWFANQADNIWSSSNPLEHGDFTPYFRASKLLEEILDNAGYEMDSTFFTRQSNLYLLMNNGQRSIVGTDNPETETMLVGLSTDLTGLSAHNPGAAITAWSESTPFYDTGSNFSGGSTFTAPFRAYYTFRINLYGRTNATNHVFSIWLEKTSVTPTETVWEILDNYPGLAFNDQVHNFTSDPILLNTGDAVKIYYEMASSSEVLNLDGDNTISPQSTWWQVLDITYPTSGQTVDVEANMPEMKQIDFVSGLQKMFNLVFIPDRNNPKKLYIEPFNDYLASGAKKDWTNKIDLSKDLTIEPTTDLQSRRYEWTHSNGKDLVNDLVFKNADRVYGRYRVDDPQNDFASGTKQIKSPFAPHVASYIPGTNYAVHRMLVDTEQADKRIKNPLPRLAFWNGTPAGEINYYEDDNSTVVTDTDYPAFSQYSALNATVTSEDLGYGPERPFHIIQANPLNTLYYQYWSPFVNQLYSSEARKLTAFFRLTRADIATFEFSDKIYLKDTYWRIMSISYDATSDDLVKVELLKVLSEVRDCQWLPIAINKATGEIQFENPSGLQTYTLSALYSSCCTKYGYAYNPTAQRCYQSFEQ